MGLFDTHVLNDKGFAEVARLKGVMGYAHSLVTPLMPEGREKAVFLTKLEEAMFFATKAIAGKEGNFKEIKTYAAAAEVVEQKLKENL